MQLSTERLLLSPVDVDLDAPALHVAYADPVVMSLWLHQPASADLQETRARVTSRLELDDARMWSVRRAGEDTVLGLVERVGATDPPGVGWMLRRELWGQGIMSEAARTMVEHLLDAGGLDQVEAWVDATNVPSIKVAQHSGLTIRGRFAPRHPDGTRHETVTLGRRKHETPQDLYAAEAVLPVRDVAATLDFLARALGFEPGFAVGDPIYRARARLDRWSNFPGVQLALAGDGPISGVKLYISCGAPVHDLYDRVHAAGGRTDGPPQPMPWGRIEFSLRLPEGHVLVVSGPV